MMKPDVEVGMGKTPRFGGDDMKSQHTTKSFKSRSRVSGIPDSSAMGLTKKSYNASLSSDSNHSISSADVNLSSEGLNVESEV